MAAGEGPECRAEGRGGSQEGWLPPQKQAWTCVNPDPGPEPPVTRETGGSLSGHVQPQSQTASGLPAVEGPARHSTKALLRAPRGAGSEDGPHRSWAQDAHCLQPPAPLPRPRPLRPCDLRGLPWNCQKVPATTDRAVSPQTTRSYLKFTSLLFWPPKHCGLWAWYRCVPGPPALLRAPGRVAGPRGVAAQPVSRCLRWQQSLVQNAGC